MVRLIFYIFDQNIYIYFLKGRRCRGGAGGEERVGRGWWCKFFGAGREGVVGGGANFSKKLELFVEAEIWNLDKFEYVESDGDFQSFLF